MNTTSSGRLEKVWGKRTMSQDCNGYIQLSVPREVVEEPKADIDAGQKVTIKGVFEQGEFHIEIEAVSD